MTSVQRWSHRELPTSLRWQAVAFVRVVWPDIEGGLVREPYPAVLEPTYYTLTHGDDLLLSLAATYTTSVAVAGEMFTATCLGNVFTFPAARRRGLGRQIVEAATQDIRASTVDVAALLCDPSLQRFYASSGWRALPHSPTITGQGEELDALRMMVILSDTAVAAQHRFTTEPLHVPTAW
jgi:GNAT superfamily N-acetyltransferase